MDKIENKFSIRRILKSNDNDYIKALKIYNEQTPASIKTPTNEISHWIDNKKPGANFEVMVFAMYLDDKVIGFAMVTYLSNLKVIVIEYLSFLSQFRVNTTFFTYLNLIQNYLVEINKNVNYFLVEISNKENGKDIDKESKFFKKLICLEGFRKLDAKYYTLQLGVDDFESSFEANLYIKSADATNSISKETYLSIIDGIYNKYYVEWYHDFLSEENRIRYKEHIDRRYEMIKKSLIESTSIDANGLTCPLSKIEPEIKTSGQVPSVRKANKILLIPLIGITVVGVPFLMVLLFNYLLGLTNIPMSSASTLIGATFSATLSTVIALFVAKKNS